MGPGSRIAMAVAATGDIDARSGRLHQPVRQQSGTGLALIVSIRSEP